MQGVWDGRVSYQPSVWPQRIGRVAIGIGFAAWAVHALAPMAMNGYANLVIDQCAAKAGLASAPWSDGHADGIFAFDAYSQWIVGDSPAKLDLIACTQKWAGPVLRGTLHPHPLAGDKSLPYLQETMVIGGERYLVHFSGTT